MKYIFMALIRFYRKFISPLKPPACRFYPTCSQYALTAIQRFGAFRGSYLAIKRLLKCHPYHPGGYDPVPESFNRHSARRPRNHNGSHGRHDRHDRD